MPKAGPSAPPEPRRRRWMLRLINYFPAFLGAGIRVRRLDIDAGVVEVEMGLHFWNRNYLGTQFGGSLYSMCDPFYVLILAERLGPRYVVWDKAATIRFRRPGRGRVHARFEISAEQIEEIRHQADAQPKVEPVLTTQILDEAGEVVAEVEKVLYVRKKS